MTARYQPGTAHLAVGGDWYDTLALPSGRIALTIGDVAGHGVDAAAAMGRIRSAIQAFSQAIPAPGTLLSQLEVFAARFSDLEYLTALPRRPRPGHRRDRLRLRRPPADPRPRPAGRPLLPRGGTLAAAPDPGAAPDRPRRAAARLAARPLLGRPRRAPRRVARRRPRAPRRLGPRAQPRARATSSPTS